jgi:hypothetical protein
MARVEAYGEAAAGLNNGVKRLGFRTEISAEQESEFF